MSTGGAYDPSAIEPRIYALWEAGGCFHADVDPARRPFTIVIPPPNVTGALHLGHALNNTLQDILIRRARMQGYNACWLPGTDHAGIATQAVVEKRLREEQGWRRDPKNPEHRKLLVDKIWEWKEEYNARILAQLRRMGCSCDWRRTRFTLDEGCARAVSEAFFRFFKDGLIYRGTRLVNWDCELQTAVSDDEVYHEAVKGHLWYVRYPIEGRPAIRARSASEGLAPDVQKSSPEQADPSLALRALTGDARPGVDYLVVATTRPETMLGDTAVAVHPDDERYKHLIGRHCILPLMNRRIPIIADGLLVKREFGTGCVKVTPAHDPNDYACYQRHPHIGIINVLTPEGRINENGRSRGSDSSRAGHGPVQPPHDWGSSAHDGPRSPLPDPRSPPQFDYVGLSRFEARKRIVADLEALGLLEKVEPYETDIGHSERSQAPIEPLLSEQWFVNMDKADGPRLAELALEAVRDGRVQFFPERFAKTYLDWLSEKRDWCISRQLWWGHRIPVWRYARIHEMFTSKETFQRTKQLVEDLVLANPDDIATPGVQFGDEVAYRVEELAGSSEETGTGIGVHPAPATFTASFPVCVRPHRKDLIAALEAHGFEQDPDVLDTWFSSALWPFSTFGWPDGQGSGIGDQGSGPGQTRSPFPAFRSPSDLQYFFPTHVLSTARDIVTLWVARMVLTALYFTGRVPFQHVLIHPTIQDAQGRRMSKSLGNGVDPLDLIEMYGADAMRFTLASMTGETQDVRVPVRPATLPDGRTVNTSERFELGRNFCNKLWQAATGYVLPNVRDVRIVSREPRHVSPLTCHVCHTSRPPGELPLFDRWIRTRLLHGMQEVDEHLSQYRFGAAADALRTFFWSEFCDWYIEESKLRVQSTDGELANDTKIVLLQTLDICLCLLHPFIPFVTEEIWQRITAEIPRHHELTWPEGEPLTSQLRAAWGERVPEQAPPLIRMPWPAHWPAAWAPECEREVGDVLQPVIRALRDIRARVNVLRAQAKQAAIRTLPAAAVRADAATAAVLRERVALLQRLGQCDAIEIGPDIARPPDSFSHVLTGIEVYVPVGGLADLRLERERRSKEREEICGHIERLEGKLANEQFVRNAPAEVVERERARLAELRGKLATIERNLAELGS